MARLVVRPFSLLAWPHVAANGCLEPLEKTAGPLRPREALHQGPESVVVRRFDQMRDLVQENVVDDVAGHALQPGG